MATAMAISLYPEKSKYSWNVYAKIESNASKELSLEMLENP
jgi:hypothetical protein